ncbi:rhomboid family intramembrane serine protease [bacterium]|nr:MAG: rhomboid family intramembrane serine protease [bacterium]
MESTPLTLLFILVTGAVSVAAFSRPTLLSTLLLDARQVEARGERWRMLTSGFVHANFFHLFVNMFSFWSFGGVIEQVFGPALLAAIYIGGILGGSLLALVVHRGENYRALGASGGVCAVIFASVLIMPGSSIYLFLIPFPIPAQVFAFLFLGWTWFGMRRRGADGIGHDAHFAGALVGVLVVLLRAPGIVSESPLFVGGLLLASGWMLQQALSGRRGKHDWR